MYCLEMIQTHSFFWSAFFRIRTRKKPVFGHFLHSDGFVFYVFEVVLVEMKLTQYVELFRG